jgi:hypothetical protein
MFQETAFYHQKDENILYSHEMVEPFNFNEFLVVAFLKKSYLAT